MTDADWNTFRARELRELSLSRDKIQGPGLKYLKALKHLEILNLAETSIDDASLTSLEGMTQLECLFLRKTRVTDDGLHRIQKALPKCKFKP